MLNEAKIQFERIKRFHEKVLNNRNRNVLSYEDDVISFFMHCWHLKDFIQNDSLCDDTLKNKTEKFCSKSESLQICRDLCHRSKHFKINDIKREAEFTKKNITIYASGVHINKDGSFESFGDPYGEIEMLVDAVLLGENGSKFPTTLNVISLSNEIVDEWELFLQLNGILS